MEKSRSLSCLCSFRSFIRAAGLVHLLAAGGWIAAVLMFLGMLLRGKEASGSGRLRSTHDFLHGFSTLGTIFVAALVVSGIVHYGDLTAWSFSALFQSTYGKFLLFKLALFGVIDRKSVV